MDPQEGGYLSWKGIWRLVQLALVARILAHSNFDEHADNAMKFCINRSQEEDRQTRCYTKNKEDVGICIDVADYESCNKIFGFMVDFTAQELNISEDGFRLDKNSSQICYVPSVATGKTDQPLANLLGFNIMVDIFGEDSWHRPIDTVYLFCVFPNGIKSKEKLENTVCCATTPQAILERALFVSISGKSYPYNMSAQSQMIDMIWIPTIRILDLTNYHLNTFVPTTTVEARTTPGETTVKPDDSLEKDNSTTGIAFASVMVLSLLIMMVIMWITREQTSSFFYREVENQT